MLDPPAAEPERFKLDARDDAMLTADQRPCGPVATFLPTRSVF